MIARKVAQLQLLISSLAMEDSTLAAALAALSSALSSDTASLQTITDQVTELLALANTLRGFNSALTYSSNGNTHEVFQGQDKILTVKKY